MDSKPIPVTYPASRKDTSVVDNYFGTRIADPYRWLEDDQSAETKDWVTRQNLVTQGYLSQIPFRSKIKKRLEQIWNFEKYTPPALEGGQYYFFKNDGLQNQAVLYRQENLNSQPVVVLDPNTFSADGTSSLGELEFDHDGHYLAYSISKGGSDWRTVFVRDLKTGYNLPDQLDWVKFSAFGWQDDGFYYTRFPEPAHGDELTGTNKFGSLYFHQLGTAQADDSLMYADKEHPDRSFSGATTDDERFLILYATESTSGNALYVKDLAAGQKTFTPIVTHFENDHSVIDNFGSKLLVLTNLGAPNQRLVLVDPSKPAPENWQTFVPENPEDVLRSAQHCGGKIVCEYLHHAASALRVFGLDGKFEKEIPLPEIGTVGGLAGKAKQGQAFFSFMSFLRPTTIFQLDMATLETKVFKAPKIDFNPENYLTEQVWFTSKDGTKVPLFITRKRQIPMDKTNPTLLYGYGGFNIPVTPSFAASRAALLENNGIYAVANIRGGGEFGEKWHKSGTKCQKQNVFDDFIGAAEYLIQQGYTSPERLAIQGGSNGGLLVGACMTQRPDLFGVAFPAVGVMDMLRYHQFTIGYAWATDYGRSDNREEFPCLRAYSPLHNLKKAKYPATLVTTADHDDRVVPAHSFKFAATLQENQIGDKPTLVRIETSAGHGAGKPTSKLLDESADILSFMLWNMKMKVAY